MINKLKKLLLNITPKDGWISIKNKALSTLWQCFLASIGVFYIAGNLSVTKDTILAFLTAFIGAILSSIKNIIVEYKKSTISAEKMNNQITYENGGLQNVNK
jgi:hypothetical protein